MENTEKENQAPKESRLIIVTGVEDVGRQFLLEALTQIINMSGYSVSVEDFGSKIETDFHVVIGKDFSIEQEAKAKLVFSSYRKPDGIIYAEAPEGMIDSKDWPEYLAGEKFILLDKFYELAKWMRSSKLAYVMDFDAPFNAKGLHNYANLRNIILPMNFAFAGEKMDFSKIKPVELINALMPDLKEKSDAAATKFEEARSAMKAEPKDDE